MSKLEKDRLFFVTWCIEQYKIHKSLDGKSSMELLDRYGVLDYLSEFYDVLHTQGRQWIMEEIDELIAKRKEAVAC